MTSPRTYELSERGRNVERLIRDSPRISTKFRGFPISPEQKLLRVGARQNLRIVNALYQPLWEARAGGVLREDLVQPFADWEEKNLVEGFSTTEQWPLPEAVQPEIPEVYFVDRIGSNQLQHVFEQSGRMALGMVEVLPPNLLLNGIEIASKQS